LKDTKFTLSAPPTITPGGAPQPQAYSQKYPSQKSVSVNLPFYKKTRYEYEESNISTEPVDLNFQWAVFVFAKPVGNDTQAINWETNLRAVTSFQDV